MMSMQRSLSSPIRTQSSSGVDDRQSPDAEEDPLRFHKQEGNSIVRPPAPIQQQSHHHHHQKRISLLTTATPGPAVAPTVTTETHLSAPSASGASTSYHADAPRSFVRRPRSPGPPSSFEPEREIASTAPTRRSVDARPAPPTMPTLGSNAMPTLGSSPMPTLGPSPMPRAKQQEQPPVISKETAVPVAVAASQGAGPPRQPAADAEEAEPPTATANSSFAAEETSGSPSPRVRSRRPPLLLHDPSAYLMNLPSNHPAASAESEYSGESGGGPGSSTTTLQELAHLVRHARYQERKRCATRLKLRQNLISTALSARLQRCVEDAARKGLADAFRAEDRKEFADLYAAVHDVKNSFDHARKYAPFLVDEPDLELQSPGGAGLGRGGSSESLVDVPPLSPTMGPAGAASTLGGSVAGLPALDVPFFNDISESSRQVFLNFLCQIRTNPDYLASRLASLSSAELDTLVTFHQGTVENAAAHPSSRSPATNTAAMSRGARGAQSSGRGHHVHHSHGHAHGQRQGPSPVERLLSFQRHDPLAAIIHTCFANSAGPDSAEEGRRRNVLATACATLIRQSHKGTEKTMIAMLDAFTNMREWTGKSSMEWYLMKILEDGAFLLDRAEDQNGTRFNLSDWTAQDRIAAEQFYDRSVDELFELLDDEDGMGLPEGALEFANELLQVVDPGLAESTKNWIVRIWLFCHWLPSVVVNPESHGMMADYHITVYGRDNILKRVARIAGSHVRTLISPSHVMAGSDASAAPPPIKTPSQKVTAHVENIMARFHTSSSPSASSRKPPSAGRLLPARSITSLRETAEARPYLVVSPCDLVTLVNALFPERRGRQRSPSQASSIFSPANSVSGLPYVSQPMSSRTQPAPAIQPQHTAQSQASSRFSSTNSNTNADTASVVSIFTSVSASSTLSEATTSREPLLGGAPVTSGLRYSPPPLTPGGEGAPLDAVSPSYPYQKRSHVARTVNNYEEDGVRLRFAVREMTQVLGLEAVRGSCHPCAERWAVIFISADGKSLSTQMVYYDDDENDDEASSSVDSSEIKDRSLQQQSSAADGVSEIGSLADEQQQQQQQQHNQLNHGNQQHQQQQDSDDSDDSDDEGPELEKDYHKLRDTILKLLEDYEIPEDHQTSGKKGRDHLFTNRASGVRKYRNKNRVVSVSEKSGSSGGTSHRYRHRSNSTKSTDRDALSTERPTTGTNGESSGSADKPCALVSMLKMACTQSQAQSNFGSAFVYYNALRQLESIETLPLRHNGYATLLGIFSHGPRETIRRAMAAIEEYDAWLVWLRQSQERHDAAMELLLARVRALRDKMWYVTDVRVSAVYEYSRNVCVALKTMGAPRANVRTVQRQRGGGYGVARNRLGGAANPGAPGGSTSSFLFYAESQITDLLAALVEHGGPNKLSDDQSANTEKWLRESGIESTFCQGEERIHRFAYEVETCMSKLIGENHTDAPVLWSSDLYRREKRWLEARPGRGSGGDSFSDTASVISDAERRYTSGLGQSRQRDLRSMSARNSSQQSFDSRSRTGTLFSSSDVEGLEYFGAASPIHTIDSASTFWSPLQSIRSPGPGSVALSRAQSPMTSVTHLTSSYSFTYPQSFGGMPPRPGTSSSAQSLRESTLLEQRLNEKYRFLDDLRQTLLSLLLSDFGNLVFARGSETDLWFEELGQFFIERREAMEREQREAIERRQQREAAERHAARRAAKRDRAATKMRMLEKKEGIGDLRAAGGASGDDAGSSDTVLGSSSRARGAKDYQSGNGAGSGSSNSMPEFPFTKAYQRLLRMFCVHPNPYTKLNALHELQQLMAASLAASPPQRRSRWAASWRRSAEFSPPNLPVMDELSASLGLDGGSTAGTSNGSATASPAVRGKPLEEAIGNIRERRTHTLPPQHVGQGHGRTGSGEARSAKSSGGAPLHSQQNSAGAGPGADTLVHLLQKLFRDKSIRPKTLFRDLQVIAAFVPSSVLDQPSSMDLLATGNGASSKSAATDNLLGLGGSKGKAFWDASLAALLLKQEVLDDMVVVADKIQQWHIDHRGKASQHQQPPPSLLSIGPSLPAGGSGGVAEPSADNASSRSGGSATSVIRSDPAAQPQMQSPPQMPSLPQLSSSMRDSIRLWIIAAKEGYPVAQRELGLHFLSNPELVPRTLHPFARPREVFRRKSGASTGAADASGGVGVGGAGSTGSPSTGVGGGVVGSSAGTGAVGAVGGSGSAGAFSVGGGGGGPGAGSDPRTDPALLALAMHWMTEAARGGDHIAKMYLQQQHESGPVL